MANATDQLKSVRTLSRDAHALDPDLPILAARAALQIDHAIGAIRGRQRQAQLRVDAIVQLAKIVSDVSTAMGGSSAARALIDHPLTANLFSQAYSDASQEPLKSQEDLKQAANKVSDLLKKASQGTRDHDPVESLELLRDFCVKLSEYAANKRQLAYGERPVPEYWRLNAR